MRLAPRLITACLIAVLGTLVTFAWAIHPKGADDSHTAVRPSPEGPFIDGPELRVSVLGTSLSAALPVTSLEQSISACTQLDTTVSIIAAAGQTSLWGAQQLERVIATRPDVIFIEFTINDADLRRRVSLQDSNRAHRDILKTLHSALPDVRIVLLRLNRAHGLRAALRPRQARYEAQLPQLAQQTRAGYLDLRGPWSNATSAQIPDGVHPTPSAIDEITLPALTTLMGQLVHGDTGCP